MNLFLAPISDLSSTGNFYKSLLNTNKELFWGIRCAQKTWLSISKDDVILFYHKGGIEYLGIVNETFIDQSLSEKLWGKLTKGGENLYWDKIITFKSVKKVKLNYSELKELAGYKPNASVRFFFKYPKNGVKSLISKYKDVNNFIKKIEA